MFFKKKKFVGIDIGSHSIKVAELDVSKKSAILQSFGMIPTPNQATANGDIINTGLIAEAIRNLLTELQSKRKSVAAGLWGASVVVKKISIPKMDENLVSEQIRWEAEQYIPFDINDVNLDFRILKSSKNSETMDLLLIAALREAIMKVVESIELSQMSCEILDINGFALSNCFSANLTEPLSGPVGIFNIGASATNFVVIEDGEVQFCRDLPVGGGIYTSEMQKAMGLSYDEAEALKISASQGQAAPEEANQVIQMTHDLIADEINGAVDFFSNTNQGQKLTRVFLTGGGIRTKGLFKRLEGVFPCDVLNPFARILVNEKKISTGYRETIRDFSAIALGLGLRGADES